MVHLACFIVVIVIVIVVVGGTVVVAAVATGASGGGGGDYYCFFVATASRASDTNINVTKSIRFQVNIVVMRLYCSVQHHMVAW